MQNSDRSVPEPSAPALPELSDAITQSSSRRGFLLMGLALIAAGCGPQRASAPMPSPIWEPRADRDLSDQRPTPQPPAPHTRRPSSEPSTHVISRNTWASGRPVPSRMNRLGNVRYITVHHDGMSPFYETSERATIDRIDRIRRYHRDHLNWGDIGYHYLIDRTGRVWEGRPIQYQGAHVRNHNENNLAILVLGNFDQQSPSSAQLNSLSSHLRDQMRKYRVPVNGVLTHREWETAVTICPGHTLQQYMERIRRGNELG